MRLAGLLELTAGLELLEREFPDGLEHHEPRLGFRAVLPLQQVLIDQGSESVQHRPAQVHG